MTLKNKILPLLAACGLLFASVVAVRSHAPPVPAQPLALPAQAPYARYIGASGIVEASTDNISLGTSLPGIVKTVEVKVGDKVRKGQPLFEIDDREYRAALELRSAKLLEAKAAVQQARITLEDYRTQYALVKDGNPRAVSVDEVQKRRHAELLASAKLDSAKAAEAVAAAELRNTQTDLDRLVVRAPIDAEILQVNVRAGEYAATGALSTPLLRLGNLDSPHIRADIDENDAWRFRNGARATAFLRGNRDLKTELGFVRVEPYVTPKTSLTGASDERVDTRVLQVIYRFERGSLPVYVGQQVDVFIEIPEGKAATKVDQPGGPHS